MLVANTEAHRQTVRKLADQRFPYLRGTTDRPLPLHADTSSSFAGAFGSVTSRDPVRQKLPPGAG